MSSKIPLEQHHTRFADLAPHSYYFQIDPNWLYAKVAKDSYLSLSRSIVLVTNSVCEENRRVAPVIVEFADFQLGRECRLSELRQFDYFVCGLGRHPYLKCGDDYYVLLKNEVYKSRKCTEDIAITMLDAFTVKYDLQSPQKIIPSI